jgi:hypothetical protein
MKLRRHAILLALASLTLGPIALAAQDKPSETKPAPGKAEGADTAREPDRPITDQDVDAKDVAMTPLSDLNLKKGEIPPLLIEAQEDPYDLTDMTRCSQIAAEIGKFDAVLGEDIDVAQAKGRRLSAGRAAQEVLGSFIPFRGLIREVSGANAQQRKIQNAIYAGTARRAFLKGTGQQRGCRYPARSATEQDIAQLDAEAEAAERAKSRPQGQPKAQAAPRNGGGPGRTIAQPVVQPTR